MFDRASGVDQLRFEGRPIPTERRVDDTGVDEIVLDLVAAPSPAEGRSRMGLVDCRLAEVPGGKKSKSRSRT
jgi:hypothetical protein